MFQVELCQYQLHVRFVETNRMESIMVCFAAMDVHAFSRGALGKRLAMFASVRIPIL